MVQKKRTKLVSVSLLIIAVVAVSLIIGMRIYGTKQSAEINLGEICADSNGCPSRYCTQACAGGGDTFGCSLTCAPKDCYRDFSAKNCPVGQNCSIWETASGDKVCYYNNPNDKRECGEEGYFGQKFECCEGYSRGVGIELADGSCDMTKGGYEGIFPYCIACGDGTCSNHENKCNCRADCR